MSTDAGSHMPGLTYHFAFELFGRHRPMNVMARRDILCDIIPHRQPRLEQTERLATEAGE